MGFPWKFMELHGNNVDFISRPWVFHGNPWNSMEIMWTSSVVHGFLMRIHGTPWKRCGGLGLYFDHWTPHSNNLTSNVEK